MRTSNSGAQSEIIGSTWDKASMKRSGAVARTGNTVWCWFSPIRVPRSTDFLTAQQEHQFDSAHVALGQSTHRCYLFSAHETRVNAGQRERCLPQSSSFGWSAKFRLYPQVTHNSEVHLGIPRFLGHNHFPQSADSDHSCRDPDPV